MDILEKICSIIHLLEFVNEYPVDQFITDKLFGTELVALIKKRAKINSSLGLPGPIVNYYTIKLQTFKENGYDLAELPINNPETFQLVYENAFRRSAYIFFSTRGPYFCKYGLYKR
jgi:hypothetical protein